MKQQLRESIRCHLALVAAERRERDQDGGLQASVNELKRYQQERFRQTYADLLDSTRYTRAARFFLDDLYGPTDYTRRDAAFQRIVPTLVRLFSTEVVQTVDSMVRLHAVSEQLDTLTARHLGSARCTEASYRQAWRMTGRAAERTLQIELVLQLGKALDRHTRRPLLRQSLKLMRGPARTAGLSELQRFLEAGFDAFYAMSGAEAFLQLIEQRENDFARHMFDDHRS